MHHAQNEIYIDRNYGGILVLWDRLFGTFQEELDSEPVIFGVRKPLANWNPFWANLQVYDYLWFDARRAGRWQDKLGVWFRRTGWRPADVAERYPKPAADLARFRKFDPALQAGLKRYVVWQFVAAAIAVLWIGRLFAAEGASAVLLPCLMLWATLYTLGLVSEGRSYARQLERLRLAVIVPLGVAGLAATGALDLAGPAGGVLLTYLGASLAGLWSVNRPNGADVHIENIKNQ